MKKSKTFILLSALNKKELKLFNEFINFSYCGKKKEVINLWKSVYSKRENEIRYELKRNFSRKSLSDLNILIQKFFILQGLEKDEVIKTILLSREMRRRNLRKYLVHIIEVFKELKRKTPINNPKNRLDLLNLNFEKYLLYSATEDYNNLYKIASEESKISEIFITYSKLFEYFNRIYSRGYRNFEESEFIKIEEVIKYIESNIDYFRYNHPNIWVLYLLYKVIQDFNNHEKINDLIEYLKENDEYLAEESLQFSYDSLFEFLIKSIEEGNKMLYEKFYKIFLDLETRGVLKRLIHIRPRYFPIFVGMSLEAKNTELTKKFINEHKHKVFKDTNLEIYKLCIAKVEFCEKYYDKVKKLMLEIKPHNPFLYIQHKTILLKTFYEKSELRYIYPLIDTINHYLKRKTEIKPYIASISTFLKCISKLSIAKKNNGKGIDLIEDFIKNNNYFLEKEWVLEKLAELKNKYQNNCKLG